MGRGEDEGGEVGGGEGSGLPIGKADCQRDMIDVHVPSMPRRDLHRLRFAMKNLGKSTSLS